MKNQLLTRLSSLFFVLAAALTFSTACREEAKTLNKRGDHDTIEAIKATNMKALNGTWLFTNGLNNEQTLSFDGDNYSYHVIDGDKEGSDWGYLEQVKAGEVILVSSNSNCIGEEARHVFTFIAGEAHAIKIATDDSSFFLNAIQTDAEVPVRSTACPYDWRGLVP